MAQRADRITCPRCGANNFDTVTACWKCGSPVRPGPAPPAGPMPAPATPSNVYERPPAAAPYTPPVQYPYPATAPAGDSGVAKRAAVALGLTIPFIGLPVGWIFMMIEDRSKQAIGRWCATWSMIGLVIHLVLTYIMIQNAAPFMLRILTPVLEGAARRGAGGGEGLPGSGLP